MSRLIISEKSDAAARIATILSQGASKRTSIDKVPVFQFEDEKGLVSVVGLRGHILELDYPEHLNKWSEVGLSELIVAQPEKRITAHNIVGVLRDLSLDADEIIIATDFDREGELIGLETARLLSLAGKKVGRAKFSAFTKHEIDTAFSQLTEPDDKLADSAECRQRIDLAWGAVLTRFISLASKQGGHNYLSVGRVQSPTLALIVERHKEIEEFVSTPYWNVSALFNKEGEFAGAHVSNPFLEEEGAKAALANCEGRTSGKVVSYERKEKDEYPLPPFNTTMFLMEATKLGMSASRAMKVAEDLYTAGYISYPRTDNTVYPPSLGLKRILEKLKDSDFKEEAEELLAQEHIRPSRGKVQTTDHPPIYPTEAATSKKLKGEKWTVYELVVRRFMATVAPPAKAEVSDAMLDVNGEEFAAKGYRMLFLGWKKYYPYFRVRETFLPELAAGEEVELKDVSSEMRMTQPPQRYSQGSLLQEMERLSLGTKSTRHDIIQKLYDRKYIEGNDLIPTPSGVAVTEALSKYAQIVTDSKMTAHLEHDMDEIANGRTTLQTVVSESQDMLSDILETMEAQRDNIGGDIRKALESQHFMGKCPDCGSDLKTIRTRFGKTFVGCSKYPDCKRTYPMPAGAKVEAVEEACEQCRSPMVRVIRRGQPVTVQCLDPDCESNLERTVVGPCPKCGKDLRIIYSRAGKRFMGCSGYPDCTQTYPLPQAGRFFATGDKCPECGAPILQISMRGRSWQSCADMNCPTRASKNSEAKTKTAAKKTAAKKGTVKKATAKKTATKKAATKKSTAKKASPEKGSEAEGAAVQQ